MKCLQINPVTFQRTAIQTTAPVRCDGCSGFLLSVNHNAVPSIIPVAVFEELSGETVDKYDCVGIMTLEGFQRFYTSWLVWNVEDPKRCSLSQLWESCQQ